MRETTSRWTKLQYFPASFFGMIMGMSGLCIALLKSETLLAWQVSPASYLLGFVVLLFVSMLAAYLYKMVRYPAAFWEEMRNPIKMNFLPAISISLLLLSAAFWALNLTEVSRYSWLAGAIMQLTLTLWVLYNWLHHEFFKIEHTNPAWFIPIVGNIVVPISGVHHAPMDVAWFFFAIGIVFWPILKSVLFYRLIFHPPMPQRLVPTLFIFVAPPAVGFISYMALNDGQLDNFARILYFFALFFTLFLMVSVDKFRKLQFALSWWAYTFPLAAMSIASLYMAQATQQAFYQWIGLAILVALALMIGYLFFKTAQAVSRNGICTPEH